jgi:hypothetical protein
VLLPTPATPFLGRERELYDAVSLVVTARPENRQDRRRLG